MISLKTVYKRCKKAWSTDNPQSLCRPGSRLKCTTITLGLVLTVLMMMVFIVDLGVSTTQLVNEYASKSPHHEGPLTWLCDPDKYESDFGTRVTCGVVGFWTYLAVLIILVVFYYGVQSIRAIGSECYYAHNPDEYQSEEMAVKESASSV